MEVLLDTGARPGDELLNLKWKQVEFEMKPTTAATGTYIEEEPSDQPPTEFVKADLQMLVKHGFVPTPA